MENETIARIIERELHKIHFFERFRLQFNDDETTFIWLDDDLWINTAGSDDDDFTIRRAHDSATLTFDFPQDWIEIY